MTHSQHPSAPLGRAKHTGRHAHYKGFRRFDTSLRVLAAKWVVGGLVALCAATPIQAACTLAGAGTVASPFAIATYAGLKQMGTDCGMSAHYELVDSIDASPSASENGGKGFPIVGSWDEPFKGSLHGRGFSIVKLHQNDTAGPYGGIFAMLDSFAVVDHLRLRDFRISRAYSIGALAAYSRGTIRDCKVSGSVFWANASQGGLVGVNYGRIVSCSFADSLVADSMSTAGGLAGTNYRIIDSSFAQGYIEGRQVGGIAGFSTGPIRHCGSEAKAKGVGAGSQAGSLVGWSADTVDTCYAKGDVEGFQIGGLVGYSTGKIRSSWATGKATGIGEYSEAGGLVGWSSGWVLDCRATGDVSGYQVGGLVGWSTKPIRRSQAYGKVTGIGEYSEAGGLVGWGGDTMELCRAEGVVSGFQAGGLVGWATGRIIKSEATGDVTGIGETSEAGGLVGSSGRPIIASFAAGKVTGSGKKAQIGGLVGWNTDSILASASTGNVMTTGDSAYAGGLVGCNASVVANAYATGEVTGKMWVGGLVGKQWQGQVSNAYATGKITKASNYALAGGVVGWDSAFVTAVYWDLQTTGMALGVAESRRLWGPYAGLSTAEMHDSANFNGFSFAVDSAWTIVQNQTTPQLRAIQARMASTSQAGPSIAKPKPLHVRRVGNSLELELDSRSTVRLLDARGRAVLDFGMLGAGVQKLSVPSTEGVLFVQVRSESSSRTFAVGRWR